jgi:hypothetical protein
MYVLTCNGLGQSAPETLCSESSPQLPQRQVVTNQTILCDILLIHLWRLKNDLTSLQNETKRIAPDRRRVSQIEQCVIQQAEKIIQLLTQGTITQNCCASDLDTLKKQLKKLPWIFRWQERVGKNVVRVYALRKIHKCHARLMNSIQNAYLKAPSSPCCDCWASV